MTALIGPSGYVSGNPPPSYQLALTDPDFKFPQVWRSNVAVDQRLPWDLIGTAEFIYSKDVNGISYINANLPAAQTALVGADNRPRWTSNRIHSNVTDATVLGARADGVVLTVGSGLVLREDARACADRMRLSDIRVLGTVVNRFRLGRAGRYSTQYRSYEAYVESSTA